MTAGNDPRCVCANTFPRSEEDVAYLDQSKIISIVDQGHSHQYIAEIAYLSLEV